MRSNEFEENLIPTIGACKEFSVARCMLPKTGIHTPVPQTLRNWLKPAALVDVLAKK